MGPSAPRIPPHLPFCVTLVDFDPAAAAEFEGVLRQDFEHLRVAVRCERGLSDASYPAEVVHAIVLTPGAIARMTERDMEVVRSETGLGTCRVYLSDGAGPPAPPEAGRLDEFIQRTQGRGPRAVAKEVAAFFLGADDLNRRDTPRAVRDRACLAAYSVLAYSWPIAYAISAVHVLNTMSARAGRGAWLERHASGPVVLASTYFGAFFVVHCVFAIARNWLFETRVARRASLEFALTAAALGAAAVATAYSVAVTRPDVARISVCAVLAVAAHSLYVYARRIRSECMSLSWLQAVMADPSRRETLLDEIGVKQFTHSAFPLLPFRGKTLFISYMHGSAWSSDAAELVHQWASRRGFEVFLDRAAIRSGSLWRRSLLRAVSECVYFVAVIDGGAPLTEWVLAESAYATLLRKSIGKPRILLVVHDIRRIADDERNQLRRLYLDVFHLPPGRCPGAAVLSVDGDRRLTEGRFLEALDGVRPMCLLS